MTIESTMEKLKISRVWVYKLVKSGKLIAEEGSRPLLITDASIKAYIHETTKTRPRSVSYEYKNGRVTVSFCLDATVIDYIDKDVKKTGKSRSELINTICKDHYIARLEDHSPEEKSKKKTVKK